MTQANLYQCCHCGAWIDPSYAYEPPAVHAGNEGTKDDPRSPGDHTRCCDQCCYGEGRCAAEKAKGGNQ